MVGLVVNLAVWGYCGYGQRGMKRILLKTL